MLQALLCGIIEFMQWPLIKSNAQFLPPSSIGCILLDFMVELLAFLALESACETLVEWPWPLLVFCSMGCFLRCFSVNKGIFLKWSHNTKKITEVNEVKNENPYIPPLYLFIYLFIFVVVALLWSLRKIKALSGKLIVDNLILFVCEFERLHKKAEIITAP